MASSAWGFNTAGIASATSPGLVQAGGYNVLPAGTVLPYAGGTAPDGFLFCDGTEISKTTYAQLYAAILDVYATQINPTTGSAWAAPAGTNFRVPDYRGSFLRGVGTALSKDATSLGGHQVEKTKAPTTAFSGTAAATGSGTLTAHAHGPSADRFAIKGSAVGIEAYGSASSSGYILSSVTTTATANIDHTHSVSISGGDNETRPINKGVNYIIKY